MGFLDHIDVLRKHIVRSVFAIVVLSCFVGYYIDWIFDNVILGPLNQNFWTYHTLCEWSQKLGLGDTLCMPFPGRNMQATQYTSQFLSAITISITLGFIAAFPYIFFEFWQFIKPALSEKERRKTSGAIFWVTLFFLLGVSFGYFILAPFTFSFLSNYTLGTMHAIETKPTLDDYLDNMINIIIGTGLAFELPVVSFVLTKVGLIGPAFLRRYRKHAFVVILLVAAIITPSPDWVSQAIVALPLYSLYELGIYVSARIAKREAATP